jgi:hypothetical protein
MTIPSTKTAHFGPLHGSRGLSKSEFTILRQAHSKFCGTAKKQIGPLAVQGEQQKVEKRHQSQQPPNRNGKTEH